MYLTLLKLHYTTELSKAEIQIDLALQNPGTSSFDAVKDNFDSLIHCRHALETISSIEEKAKEKNDSPEQLC